METKVLNISESVYDKNRTMKLIGYQYYSEILNSEKLKDIEQILNARTYCYDREVTLDIFVLGYIYGKRAERLRRRGEK